MKDVILEPGEAATSRRLPILMTASVSTRGMRGACFDDDARETMYLGALQFYLEELPDYKIVFAENSGWNLRAMADKVPAARGRVEWIALNPEDYDVSKGKGYNESILISQAIDQSVAIQTVGAFMKVTGRYPIYNLGRYLRQGETFILEQCGKYYGDMKDHGIYDILFPRNTKKWNGHAAYTVLFACANSFYKDKLGPLYVKCDDYSDNWIEKVWFEALKPYRGQKDSGVSLRFKWEPNCGGRQGSTNSTFSFSQSNKSLMARFKRVVRNLIRRYMPWLWL